MFEYQWAAADSAFRRTIALSPAYSTAYSWYEDVRGAIGRFDEQLLRGQRAVAIDRLSPNALNTVGWALMANGQIDEAYRWFENAPALDPDFLPANLNACIIDLDRADSSGFFRHTTDQAMKNAVRPLCQSGGRDAVRHVLIEDVRTPPTFRAEQRIAPGDVDGAVRGLNTVIATHDRYLTFLYPIFVGLIRKDPRFAALRYRAGLPAPAR